MMTQLELFAAREQDERARLVDRLLAYLERERRWRTRAEIRRDIGLTDREVREARQYSGARICFGQDGFMASRWASADDLVRCANVLDSQARCMAEQAAAYRRMAHGRVG